jgi:type III pantothenate kinase
MDSIPHVLACDVGNTAIHLATVQGDTVSEMRTLRLGELTGLSDELKTLWESIPDPKKILACSVNPSGLKALEAAALEAIDSPVLVVGRDLPLPMKTALPQPERIGTDRLCAALAAFDQLGQACVVADFGTAITIDCVNSDGVFVGGAILPGLHMGQQSLAEKTAQLPPVKLVSPDWVFGQNTDQAIIGGLVYGARGALRHFVETYATELNQWPLVIITGGDAELICPDVNESGIVQARVEDLTLRGVAMAYYKTLLD